MRITRRVLLGGLAGTALVACQPDERLVLEPIRPSGARPGPTPTTKVIVSSTTNKPTPAPAAQAGQGAAQTQPPKPAATAGRDEAAGQRMVEEFLRQQKGRVGLAARDFQGASAIDVRSGEKFELASVYKVVLMAEVMRRVGGGELKLADRIKTAPEYAFGEPEGGIPPGTSVTIDDAIGAMIRVSSNAAALALIDRVGAREVEAAPGRLGMAETTVDVSGGNGPGSYLVEAHGSARDLAGFLVKLGRGQVVNRDLDARMAGYLLGNRTDDRLPSLLPAGTQVAHKTGELENLTHDVGIVYLTGRPYAVAVLAEGESPTEGRAIVAEVSRMLFAWYGGGR